MRPQVLVLLVQMPIPFIKSFWGFFYRPYPVTSTSDDMLCRIWEEQLRVPYKPAAFWSHSVTNCRSSCKNVMRLLCSPRFIAVLHRVKVPWGQQLLFSEDIRTSTEGQALCWQRLHRHLLVHGFACSGVDSLGSPVSVIRPERDALSVCIPKW